MSYMNKFKSYFPFIYAVILIVSFFYIKSVLKQDTLEVNQVENVKKEQKEVKPVSVNLSVVSARQNMSYSLRKEDDETFDDFIEDLVDDGKLTYEKTEYTYGTVYDDINGEKAPEGYEWRLYKGDEEITYNTSGVKLEDDATYKFILSEK